MANIRQNGWHWQELHLRDGRRLDKHPAWIAAQALMGPPEGIRIGEFWSGPEEAMRRQEQRLIPKVYVSILGGIMDVEELAAILRESNEEMGRAQDEIEKSSNRIKALKDVVFPKIKEIKDEMRQARMTTEQEMKQTLEWLDNVRNFFLVMSYEKEMERLKEFISVCKQIEALKASGTLEAVSDLAIKMAIGRDK